MTDSRGCNRGFAEIFYVLQDDTRDQFVLWCLPFLGKATILIDPDAQPHRRKSEDDNFMLGSPKNFAQSLHDERQVCALILDAAGTSAKIGNTIMSQVGDNLEILSTVKI